MDTAQLNPVNYSLYSGEYSVVVFDWGDAELSITDLSKVLNPIAMQHQLNVEKTIWLLYYPGAKLDDDDFDYQFGFVHNHFGELHFTSQMEIIPQILFQALLSRCGSVSHHSISLPDEQEWKRRKELQRKRILEEAPELKDLYGTD